MKITKTELKQIIQEEIQRITETHSLGHSPGDKEISQWFINLLPEERAKVYKAAHDERIAAWFEVPGAQQATPGSTEAIRAARQKAAGMTQEDEDEASRAAVSYHYW